MFPHPVPGQKDAGVTKRTLPLRAPSLRGDVMQRESWTPLPMTVSMVAAAVLGADHHGGGLSAEDLGCDLAVLFTPGVPWLLLTSRALFS